MSMAARAGDAASGIQLYKHAHKQGTYRQCLPGQVMWPV